MMLRKEGVRLLNLYGEAEAKRAAPVPFQRMCSDTRRVVGEGVGDGAIEPCHISLDGSPVILLARPIPRSIETDHNVFRIDA
jgi:hypothetical protein